MFPSIHSKDWNYQNLILLSSKNSGLAGFVFCILTMVDTVGWYVQIPPHPSAMYIPAV